MAWVEVFAVFLVSHLTGDYLLQTDWQARHKRSPARKSLSLVKFFLHPFDGKESCFQVLG